MAEELKLGKPVTPEYFDEVTIYFSEIMAFIDLASESTPMEVKYKIKKYEFQSLTTINFVFSLFIFYIIFQTSETVFHS